MNINGKPLVTAFLIEGFLILFFNSIIFRDRSIDTQQSVRWLFFAGFLFLGGGFFLSRSDNAFSRLHDKLQNAGQWLGISVVQVFLLFTSGIFVVLTITAAGFWNQMYSPIAAVATWLTGIGGAIYGAWNFADRFPRVAKKTMVWFAVVTVFAFACRGFATGRIPVILTGDEASAGVSAIDFATGEWNNIFVSGWFSFPSLFSAIQSIGIRLLGNTVEALRIPSALIGALTVGLVYIWGKSLFGQRAGLFAAFVLGSLHFHVHFSRLGLNNIWDGLWYTLTLGAVWHGWGTGKRWSFILAGVGLGFSQYFYASGKALPILLLILAVITAVFQRPQFRRALPHLVTMMIVAFVIVLPLVWHYANDPKAFLATFARVSIIEESVASKTSIWNFLSHQVPMSLGAYTFTESVNWYLPGIPILRPLAAVFFFAGLIALLIRDRDSRFAVLILWLFMFALINALSSYAPAAQRYVAAAPACALLVGYGLDSIAGILERRLPRMQPLISTISVCILALIVIGDLWFYFVDYTTYTSLDESTSNGMVAHQFGDYLRQQPPGTQYIVFGAPRLQYDSPAVLYLAPEQRGINAPKEWASFDKTWLVSDKVIFVFLPEYKDDIDLIQNTFPGGTLIAQHTWTGSTIFWVYELRWEPGTAIP